MATVGNLQTFQGFHSCLIQQGVLVQQLLDIYLQRGRLGAWGRDTNCCPHVHGEICASSGQKVEATPEPQGVQKHI